MNLLARPIEPFGWRVAVSRTSGARRGLLAPHATGSSIRARPRIDFDAGSGRPRASYITYRRSIGELSTSAHPRPSVWAYRSLIWNFAQRDLKSRFKGTVLGRAWSLLLPLGTLLIYTLVFSVVFRFQPPPLGNGNPGNFAVW